MPALANRPVLGDQSLDVCLSKLQWLVTALEVEKIRVRVLAPIFVFEKLMELDAVNGHV